MTVEEIKATLEEQQAHNLTKERLSAVSWFVKEALGELEAAIQALEKDMNDDS